jgi:N utilization substance protein A
MTHEELNEGIEKAEGWFSQIPGATPELVEAFIEEGFLSYDDLTFLEPAQLAELAGVTEDEAEEMILFAEESAERVEEENRIAAAAAAEQRAAQAAAQAAAPAASTEEAARPKSTTPTLESLFGPDVPEKEEKPLSAAEVFGETPPAAPEPPAEEKLAE